MAAIRRYPVAVLRTRQDLSPKAPDSAAGLPPQAWGKFRRRPPAREQRPPRGGSRGRAGRPRRGMRSRCVSGPAVSTASFPDNSRGASNRCAARMRAYPEAEKPLARALELSPNNAAFHYHFGLTCIRLVKRSAAAFRGPATSALTWPGSSGSPTSQRRSARGGRCQPTLHLEDGPLEAIEHVEGISSLGSP